MLLPTRHGRPARARPSAGKTDAVTLASARRDQSPAIPSAAVRLTIDTTSFCCAAGIPRIRAIWPIALSRMYSGAITPAAVSVRIRAVS